MAVSFPICLVTGRSLRARKGRVNETIGDDGSLKGSLTINRRLTIPQAGVLSANAIARLVHENLDPWILPFIDP
jgi:hypothetical protein